MTRLPMLATLIASGLLVPEQKATVLPEPQPCGSCTQCCKLLGVKEIDKPEGRWCKSCDIGKGCRVYETRPQSCQDFNCAYAQGLMLDVEACRPDNSHVVFSFTTDGAIPVAYVDPHRQDAWKEGAAGRWFERMVSQLGKGIVVCGHRRSAVGKGWSEAELETILRQGQF